MEERPSVSVVIITRNRAEWLRDALHSLARQTRQPDEVVVVDNDSGDHTKDVVLEFARGRNVKYVYEPVRGIPRARNAGVMNSSGEIIAFLDDDCVADEDWLKYIEIPFVKDPNVGVVGGRISYDQVGMGRVEAFYIEKMSSSSGAGASP